MGKENKCKYFGTGTNQCGFAKWLEEKPYSDTTIPENGCGKSDIESCNRLSSKDLKNLEEYGPCDMEEHNIALPPKYTNSKGRKKRLP
ncbi:hypothetical protein KJ570_00155 [Patescibacteria group bacterium]|nr:hypothetical protein [Patescibacteria group bacterium]MBU2036012.1 hypothetical protein [Patescibacteria group bacterium]